MSKCEIIRDSRSEMSVRNGSRIGDLFHELLQPLLPVRQRVAVGCCCSQDESPTHDDQRPGRPGHRERGILRARTEIAFIFAAVPILPHFR